MVLDMMTSGGMMVGTVEIAMVGDVLLHTPVEEAARNEAGEYDFDFIFSEMKDEISAADIALANQEVIIGGEELGVSGYPAFNAPYEIGDALTDAGFDVICHATNHALDKGEKGIQNALSYWEEKHPEMIVVGINKSQNDKDEVTIIEKNGLKIAVLNYTYGTNGIPMPADMPYAVDMLDEAKIRKDLEYAESNADFTIVCPHWGTEYRLEPDTNQEYWTEIFREGGADLVIGTHPHVIEPVEFLEDEMARHTNNHGDGDMLVYYSLGNFVNWTSGTGEGVTNRMVGGMAKVTIRKGFNGDTHISDYGVEALVCHVESGHENVRIYPLSEYTEDMAEKNEILKQDSAFSRDNCVKLCDRIWDDKWK
ncbi:CapA family protein [Butyrivibrio sp. NC2002]|uniref:CapA family protein n=1 Tax=Butyrivibrio sp. NC2002 TaxID=1410610 RepID=UPI0009E0B2DB|nr:CapA family protein [Butyrivibrio sp. NC2002]